MSAPARAQSPAEVSPGVARSRLVMVSNRLPVTARWRAGRLQLSKSAGGLATGLNQLRRQQQGLWVGWPGDTSGDTPEQLAELNRRLEADSLIPVHLSQADVAGYYDGFSNGVVWPLFHYLLDRIPIDGANWEAYERVNRQFAEAVVALWKPGDRIWVHDYQLMLVPAMVRSALQDAQIGFFLHIPFPALDVFRTLPWRTRLLEGLLGADVVGFHTASYAQHFLETARRLLDLDPSADRVAWQGRPVLVDAFPMAIDEREFRSVSDRPAVRARSETIRTEAHGRKILLGVDRLDYTKGIPRRLVAFQRLLERDPSLRDRVRLIQVAVPSRIDVGEYRRFRREIDELIGRINGKFGTVDAVPIHYLYRSVAHPELVALYRAADVMLVTPLRDGMNLVAKEFVASRTDEDGVLILSEFAGAADEMTDALLVNPYDTDGVADAMSAALALGPDERRRRMRALRQVVAGSTVHTWAGDFLGRLERPSPPRTSSGPASGNDALEAQASGELDIDPPLTLLLDYDGTLVPFASSPDRASPDSDLLTLLASLAAAPHIDLHLVSGRSFETIDPWFRHLPAGLWAEHGARFRPGSASGWESAVPDAVDWMPKARAVLEESADRTPGAIVEQKASGMAWHYRMVEPALAARRLVGLRQTLAALLRDAPVDLLEGHMVLELRPRGVSKGNVVREIARRTASLHRIIAIGDDNTDEEMFAALPAGSVAIRVGGGTTRAAYRLADPPAVRRFLATLLVPRGGRQLPRRDSAVPTQPHV